MKKANWYVLSIFALTVTLLVAQSVMLLTSNSNAKDVLYIGNIETYVNGEAVIIRDETVYNPNDGNPISPVVLDGKRVSKNEVIARTLDNSSTATLQQYETAKAELLQRVRSDYSIQNINAYELKKSNTLLYEKFVEMMLAAPSETFENAILFENDIKEISDAKVQIILENIPKDSGIMGLKNKADNLFLDFNNSTGAVKSLSAGIISFVVDGTENEYKIEKVMDLSSNDLAHAKNFLYESVEKKITRYKVIRNFEAYLVLELDKKTVENLNVDAKRDIKINDTSESVEGTLVRKVDAAKPGVSLMTFRIDRGIEKTCDLRKVNVDIALARNKTEGFKIPITSLMNTDFVKMTAEVALVRKQQVEIRKVTLLDFDSANAIITDLEPNSYKAIQYYEEYLKNPLAYKEGDVVK
ncbi:MAG: HlyD family efflux transporter periplasmic adaptor subunit [Bacillota bacterium]